MIKVNFTQKDMQDDKDFQNKIDGITEEFDSTIILNEQHNINAFLSELAFKRLLEHCDVDYIRDEVEGKSDRFDFEINGQRYDVKCNDRVYADTQIHEEAINKAKENKCRIAWVNLDKKKLKAKIYGWANPSDFRRMGFTRRSDNVELFTLPVKEYIKFNKSTWNANHH